MDNSHKSNSSQKQEHLIEQMPISAPHLIDAPRAFPLVKRVTQPNLGVFSGAKKRQRLRNSAKLRLRQALQPYISPVPAHLPSNLHSYWQRTVDWARDVVFEEKISADIYVFRDAKLDPLFFQVGEHVIFPACTVFWRKMPTALRRAMAATSAQSTAAACGANNNILAQAATAAAELEQQALRLAAASVATSENAAADIHQGEPDEQEEELNSPLTPLDRPIPTLHHKVATHPAVSPMILRGADLLLPGVIVNRHTLPVLTVLQAGTVVLVTVVGNPFPLAVGVWCISNVIHHMQINGKKGKAVRIIHCFRDKLWASSSGITPPGFSETIIEPILKEEQDVTEDEEWKDEGSATTAMSWVPTAADMKTPPAALLAAATEKKGQSACSAKDQVGSAAVLAAAEKLDGDKQPLQQVSDHDSDSDDDTGRYQQGQQQEEMKKVLSKDEMDAHLVESLDRALWHCVTDAALPMVSSTLWAFVKRCARSGSSVRGGVFEAQVSKSSWKKMGKFLKAQAKRGHFHIKQMPRSTEFSIMSISRTHPAFENIKLTRKPKVVVQQGAEGAATRNAENVPRQRLVVLHRYRPRGRLKALFFNHVDVITMDTAKTLLFDYIKKNDLSVGAQVRLDSTLCSALWPNVRKSAASAASASSSGASRKKRVSFADEQPPTRPNVDDLVGKREVAKRLTEELVRCYAVIPEKDSKDENVLSRLQWKPVPEALCIVVAVVAVKRNKRKRATEVYGSDYFGLPMESILAAAKNAFSVGGQIVRTEHNPGKDHVSIQGDHAKAVGMLLVKDFGIPMDYIKIEQHVQTGGKKSSSRR